jgi:hypothetical protein
LRLFSFVPAYSFQCEPVGGRNEKMDRGNSFRGLVVRASPRSNPGTQL